jgi:FtsZ-binding cell division protein ZapB
MSNQLDAIIDSLLDGESPQLYAAASVIESQAREIESLEAKNEHCHAVLLLVRKAMCGDINNEDNIIEMAESQAREIDELKERNNWLQSDRNVATAALKAKEDTLCEMDVEIKELRAALVVAVDAMEDFDYDKRMAALTKCKEVL